MIINFGSVFKKDFIKAKQTGFTNKIENLLHIIKKDPYQTPPPYEKLAGHPSRYSRRINVHHRLVYEIKGDTIRLLKCWGHYE